MRIIRWRRGFGGSCRFRAARVGAGVPAPVGGWGGAPAFGPGRFWGGRGGYRGGLAGALGGVIPEVGDLAVAFLLLALRLFVDVFRGGLGILGLGLLGYPVGYLDCYSAFHVVPLFSCRRRGRWRLSHTPVL